MMAACPLHKQKTNKRRSFTSLQMSHTHTKDAIRIARMRMHLAVLATWPYNGLTSCCGGFDVSFQSFSIPNMFFSCLDTTST